MDEFYKPEDAELGLYSLGLRAKSTKVVPMRFQLNLLGLQSLKVCKLESLRNINYTASERNLKYWSTNLGIRRRPSHMCLSPMQETFKDLLLEAWTEEMSTKALRKTSIDDLVVEVCLISILINPMAKEIKKNSWESSKDTMVSRIKHQHATDNSL